jgi:hypothetical protein
MSEQLKPKELAQFAAEGVAIAMRARAATHIPIRIICGIPPEVFNVEINKGVVTVGDQVRGQ